MRASLYGIVVGIAFQAAGCYAPVAGGDPTAPIDTSGGQVQYTDPANPTLVGTTVVIPPGALQTPVNIQIVPCDSLARSGETAVGPCVRFLPADLTFAAPVTVTIPYVPQQVPSPSDLTVKNVFQTVPSWTSAALLTANQAARTVTTQVKNLGDYQAITKLPPGPPPTQNVDILFLMDNSPSMVDKQKGVVKNIQVLLDKLDTAGINYHIGIATSDVGSDVMPGVPWGGNIGKCDTYEGDDGVLQAVACDTRTDVSSDAKNACSALCPDDRFVPNDGHRYISKVDGVTNVPTAFELDPNTGAMVDRGPLHAFQCMGLVGDSGCGIEGQLEGAKRALDSHRSENAGFLRKDSFLAVIFLTDEDDCSVQIARRSENNPTTRDCDPAAPDSYDCYNVDFRCLARSIQCDQTTLIPGVKTNCKERPNNYLTTVDQYYKFFSALRAPSRLLVSGIWTQPSIFNGGHFEVAKGSGGSTTPFLNRAAGSGASCTYSGDASVFGQAQYRLSNFAKQFGNDKDGTPNALESSICDLDNFPTTIGKIGSTILSRIGM